MAMLQCEVCGGKLVGKPGGIFECEYCGMQYDTSWAKAKIQEIKGTVQVEGTVEVKGTVKVEGSANVESLLKRGNNALEDGRFDEAKTQFEKVLDINAECAEAYLGLAMAELEARTEKDFLLAGNFRNKNYLRAKQYADKSLLGKFVSLEAAAEDTLIANRAINNKVRNMIAVGTDTIGVKSNGNVVDSKNLKRYRYSGVSLWADIVAVAAGIGLTVGLKSDGTVVALGENEDGQCNVSEWRNIVSIAAGSYHTVGLKSDGTVVAVGQNKDGQCNVSGWRNIVAVSAGYSHTVGLKSDGTVFAVGSNNFDQCNVSEWGDIVAVSAGGWHTVGLKSDGTVVATGRNMEGQCNISEWGKIVAVSAGSSCTVGIKLDGTVVAVGYNGDGECNVSSWKDIVAVSAGNRYNVGLKSDGTVYFVGRTEFLDDGVWEWKLFDDLDNIEDERKNRFEEGRHIAEAMYQEIKRIEKENEEWRIASEKKRIEEQKADYRQKWLCQHCGGKFKGMFKKVCTNCGKEKDY